ncbi:MAG: DUF4340 domain-containing protein [Phycisphaerales bacterium]|nr:DUF4340 domain-containing protein [Phycisphaerales bacterium]
MNFKTTAILIVLVLAGGLTMWFVRPAAVAPKPEPAEEKPAEPKYLFDPKPVDADVVKIDVQRRDKPRMVFERAPKADDPSKMDDWRMTSPSASAVEAGLVGNMSGLVSQMQIRGTVEENPSPETLNATGFSPSRGTVILTMKDGKEFAVEFGKVAPATTDTYVRMLGKPAIYLARGDLVKQHLSQDVKNFRSKTLLKATTGDIARFEIEYEGKKYELTRGPDKAWMVQSPIKAYGDTDKVNGFLSKLTTLRLADFAEDAPATLTTYGLEQPYLTLTVTTEAKRPKPTTQPASTQPVPPEFEIVTKTTMVQFGSFSDLKSENRFARLADQQWVGTIPKATVEGLLPKLNEWRDTRVTRVTAGAATKIELTAGDASATLERVDGKWRGSGDLAEIEPDAVSDMLNAFEDLRFTETIDQPEDPAKYGLDKPRAIIRVTTSTSVEPITLRVGKTTEGGRNAFVSVDGQSSVFYIAAPQAERLSVAPISLRARSIVSANVLDLRKIEVERPNARYVMEYDAAWKMVEPAGVPVDASGIRELSNDLVRLRARKVAGKGDDPRFGLDRPDVTIRFTLAPPSTTQPTTQAATQPALTGEHVLRVKKTDRVHARRDDDPFVYELDETVYRVMTSELISRQLFDFSGDAVVEFRVEAPAGTLHLAKQDKVWKYVTDLGVKLSQKVVSDYMNEISRMRAESYIAYRDGNLEAEGLATPPAKVTIKLANGREITIGMQQQASGQLPRKAAVMEEKRIFIMRQADAENLLRSVDAYIQPDKPAQPETPEMPGDMELPPGMPR